MKKIGKSGTPDIHKCLSDYIKAEEERILKMPYSAGFLRGIDDFFSLGYDDYGYDDEDDDYHFLHYDDMNDTMRHLTTGIDEEFDAEYYAAHRLDKKKIYFYPNLYNEESRKVFNNMKDFNEFCNDNNYFMTDNTAMCIMKNKTSHCCLDPDDLKCGDKIIIADHSYGGLLYSVCDDDEYFN